MPTLKRQRVTRKMAQYDPIVTVLKLFPSTTAWKGHSFVSAMAALREVSGKTFPDLEVSPASAPEILITKIEGNISLLRWMESEQCLVSPPKWPKEILPAFSRRLIPSPYEFINVNMKQKRGTKTRQIECHAYLTMYAMGMDLDTLAAVMDESVYSVLTRMYEGVEYLFKIPQFVIWATATDFRRANIPPRLEHMHVLEKLALVAKLAENPFTVPDDLADLVLESPPYLTYLVYSSPKQPRLTRTCRKRRTRERYYATTEPSPDSETTHSG